MSAWPTCAATPTPAIAMQASALPHGTCSISKTQGRFVLIDEYVAAPGMTSSVQWNIHSWNSIEVNEQERIFRFNVRAARWRGISCATRTPFSP